MNVQLHFVGWLSQFLLNKKRKLILKYSAQQKLLQQQKQNMTQQICLVFIDIHGTISVEHCVLRKKTIRLVME